MAFRPVGPTISLESLECGGGATDAPAAHVLPAAIGNDVIAAAPRVVPDLHTLLDARPADSAALSDIAAMSLPGRIAATARSGFARAAADTAGAFGSWLAAHPARAAAMGAAGGAYLVAQTVPGVNLALDVTTGIVGAAMYAAAGPEHKARITQSLGRLRDYAGEVSAAKTPADLERASAAFADFLEMGGKEAADALGNISGLMTMPAKVLGLAEKIREIGGLNGIVAAGSNALDAAGSAGTSALAAFGDRADAVGAWLDRHLSRGTRHHGDAAT